MEYPARGRPDTLAAANEELADGPRRQFVVPSVLASALGAAEGDLVELVTGRGAPLRGWLRLGGEGETVIVSATSLDILGVGSGDRVELRSVARAPESRP